MTMKLWQLDSILCADYGKQRVLTVTIANKRSDWQKFAPLFEDIWGLYESDQKEVLNTVLPDDFVMEVLKRSGFVCYKFCDGSLRSYKYENFDGETISAADVYKRYGAEVLEHVFDRSVAGDANDDPNIRKILGTDF